MAKLHRHKKSHCEFDPHNNSVLGAEHRTKIILSTEHQYKKLLCYTKNKENSEKKQNSETIFFTVTEVILYDIQVY